MLKARPARAVFLLAPVAFCAILAGPVQAGICKWVDENGVTHYAERCPEQVEAREVEIAPPPPAQQLEESRLPAQAPNRTPNQALTRGGVSDTADFQSLPASQLGPMPLNTTSLYLETIGTGILTDLASHSAKFTLSLKARDNLPGGAWLETYFPDPANPARSETVSRMAPRTRATIRFESPLSHNFRCWNYEVITYIYSDKSATDLLDTHRQLIQSRLDMSLGVDDQEWLKALAGRGSMCPSRHQQSMKKMSVEQLERLCEEARQEILEPEREKLIMQCIKTGKKQPEYCRHYYADWGDAMRLDRATMRPALYYDIPECIAARKARLEAGGP